MTPFAMAWRRIVRRPAAALLSMLLVALGVAAVAATLLVIGQVDRAAEPNAAAADLVIGARTSPMQLVLAGIFHLDAPPARFDVRQLEPALRNPVVRQWVPLALGDSVHGFRVVGSQPADFTALYGGGLAQGHWPQAEGEAVLGAEVARATGLALGARFATTHGLVAGGQVHAARSSRVAGVLARTGTVLDKLVLTRLETVWNAHAEAGPSGAAAAAQGRVSLVLVKFRSPLGA
jgi:putative ABC transport system permease protein